MKVYQKDSRKSTVFTLNSIKTTCIHFEVNGDGTEWIDAGLPTPNYFYRPKTYTGIAKDIYCMAYLIDGYFKTQKNQEYLNDIIARFITTLPVSKRFKNYPPSEAKQIDKVYKLKEFQNLKSICKHYVPHLKSHDKKDDNTFWELKLWLEYQIKNAGGEGRYVPFELFLDHALEFYEWKDRSTAKSKCRNIWNWYDRRDWCYHIFKRKSRTLKQHLEETMATRAEHMRNVKKQQEEKNRAKVVNAITGLMANAYKKKSGSWHIEKIAEATGLHRNTIRKHLREFEAQLQQK